MQKFIAKFGCAAHLAVLTVAPLFLYPFVADETLAVVLLWLSAVAAVWVLMSPSVRDKEYLHRARRRVASNIVRDPLFWVSLALVIFMGLRAVNTGVSLSYDSETAKWFISSATNEIMPGSVKTAGFLPFSLSVALMILLQGHRHSLGLSARMAYLFISSALAGLASVLAHLVIFYEQTSVLSLLSLTNETYSFVGFSYGLLLLSGLVALVAAFEHQWKLTHGFLVLSIGGTAAGVFSFSTIYISGLFAVAALVLLAYSFAYSMRYLESAGAFKMLILGGISLVLGALMVAAILPEEVLAARLDAFMNQLFFADQFWKTRTLLSEIAQKSWLSHLWIGTGLGSFSFDFRFHAGEDAWLAFPRGVIAMNNGWWQMLAECGIIGVVAFVLPFGFLLFTYVRRAVGYVQAFISEGFSWELPHPASLLLILSFSLFVAVGFFDNSLMRSDALMAVESMMAVSAASFPRKKGETNG